MLTQHPEARRLFCYVAAAGVSASLAGYYSVNANLGRGVPGSQPGALLGCGQTTAHRSGGHQWSFHAHCFKRFKGLAEFV